MTEMDALSPNTKAILLLTAPLIAGRGKKSSDLLTPGEYKKLARHLVELSAMPAELLTPAADQLLGDCHRVIDKARLERLLARGFLLSQAIERWHARAIWVVSRADDTYPQKLKKRLREDSPAVLYGCGDRKILDGGGLAVVGSRNVDEELIEYTQQVGRLAASAGRTLVSGGARGVDQAAMRGALEAGGKATGVLADSLERAAMQREHRNMLLDGQLVLISPYDPSAGFNVGHAMQRNKLVYALADAALVVSADLNNGGTWAGAVEQLEKLHLVPLFVRRAGEVSAGLAALEAKGALPWPEPTDADGLNAAIESASAEPAAARGDDAQLSFGEFHRGASEVREQEPALSSADAATPALRALNDAAPAARAQRGDLSAADELFETVRAVIVKIVCEPMKAEHVARELEVTQPQAQRWLNRLSKEGLIGKVTRPVRFVPKDSAPPPARSESDTAAKPKSLGRK